METYENIHLKTFFGINIRVSTLTPWFSNKKVLPFVTELLGIIQINVTESKVHFTFAYSEGKIFSYSIFL
jgi:hypothetical protein